MSMPRIKFRILSCLIGLLYSSQAITQPVLQTQINSVDDALLNNSELDRIDFPPFRYSRIWMPELVVGEAEKVCQDYLQIQHLAFLPLSSNHVPKLGDLPSYKSLEWDLAYPGPSIFREAEDSTDPFDIEAIISPESSTVSSGDQIWKLEFRTEADEFTLILDSHYGSWRGYSGQINLLNPNTSFDKNALASLSPSSRQDWMENNTIEIEDSFVGHSSRLSVAMDGRVFFENLSRGYAVSRDLFQLTPAGLSKEPICKVHIIPGDLTQNFKMGDSGKLDHNLHIYPGLQNLQSLLLDIQGGDNCGGTIGCYQSKDRQILRNRRFEVQPWTFGAPYNSPQALTGHLRVWSLQDPWSRQRYLEMYSIFEDAKFDIRRLITRVYGYSPNDIDRLTNQTIYFFIGGHFTFPNRFGLEAFSSPAEQSTLNLLSEVYEGGQVPDLRNRIKNIYDGEDDSRHIGFRWLTGGVSSPEFHFFAASLLNDSVFEQFLQDAKLDLDMSNHYGKTVLMYAAHLNLLEKVDRLLSAGAAINQVTMTHKNGPITIPRTALDYALENADFAMINHLLEAGAERAENELELDQLFKLNPHLSRFEIELLRSRLESKNP